MNDGGCSGGGGSNSCDNAKKIIIKGVLLKCVCLFKLVYIYEMGSGRNGVCPQ